MGEEHQESSVDPEGVPWDRVVHCYGRATDVPAAVRQLGEDGHVAAELFLLRNLEHQDGVTQATPLAVRSILRAQKSGMVRDPAAVQRILDRIAASARFQVSNHPDCAAMHDWSLYSEERLWPPFSSDEDDEAFWEDWDTPIEEWVGWAVLSLALLDGEIPT